MNAEYLESVKKQFQYYKLLGERTFEQLTDAQLFHQFNEESNSIAIIVQHLWSNMLSRWTDFLNTDGEKDWRNRDAEFENIIQTRAEMMEKWHAGWACLFLAIDSINNEDLDKIIYIRNQGHTVLEAINRQLAHYPYHIGQIVYLGKMYCDQQWESLSIPKAKSNEYNAIKFAATKQKQHFTDEYIQPNDCNNQENNK